MRTIFLDPDFRPVPKTDRFCCVCYKDLRTPPKYWARLLDPGTEAVLPADYHLVPEDQDLGSHPVGNDCAKRIGLEWFSTVAGESKL